MTHISNINENLTVYLCKRQHFLVKEEVKSRLQTVIYSYYKRKALFLMT